MRGLIGILAVVLFACGCGHAIDDCHNTRTCPPPPDAGVVVVVSDAGVECNGTCAPAVADIAGWSTHPVALWRGPATKLPTPQCPPQTSSTQFWYSAPDQTPLSCPTCSCKPSTGSCSLPGTVTVSSSQSCPGDADAGAPFDPPSEWDGGCTTNDAIAAVDCDGGPCLATVGPLAPMEAGCAPSQAVVAKVVTWGLVAYACAISTNDGTCGDLGEVCAPTPPPALGFSLCVSRQGADPLIHCPPGYPHQDVFYLGGDDERGCAPCECGPPQGDSCSSSLVSFYTDDACTVQVGSVMATSAGPMCVSIPDDSPLGSKQASAPTYTPGTCQPNGGEPTGSVKTSDPFTFCCQE
jgi:hypothetical protein